VINTNVASTNIACTNVANTTILRGGGDPVAAVPGTVATAGAVAAGTAAVAGARTSAVAALPCSTDQVLVNGIHYSQCGSTWFTRSYVDGNVAHVVTNPPG
jgi:hypothetical protein